MPSIQNPSDHASYQQATIEWATKLPYNPKVLAVIPARGGSKGLKRKNARLLCGKPLVSYSIEAALSAQLIDRVIVSTDDDEIIDVSDSYIPGIALRRPEHLSGDQACLADATTHVLDQLAQEGYRPGFIVELLPTHPFRTAGLIDFLVAIGLSGHSQVFTIRRIPWKPRSLFQPRKSRLVPLFDRSSESRVPVRHFRRYGLFSGFSPGASLGPYMHEITSPAELIDIDYPSDFALAEEVLRNGLFTPIHWSRA